jgi:hypothetical protein
MTIKENYRKPSNKIFRTIERIEINNQKLINNNNLLIKTLKDQDLELLNLETIQKETRKIWIFRDYFDRFSCTLMKNCDQLSNLLPKPKESSKKKRTKTRS